MCIVPANSGKVNQSQMKIIIPFLAASHGYGESPMKQCISDTEQIWPCFLCAYAVPSMSQVQLGLEEADKISHLWIEVPCQGYYYLVSLSKPVPPQRPGGRASVGDWMGITVQGSAHPGHSPDFVLS